MQPARLVLHLSIELPHTPATLDALAELLTAVADLPGATVTLPEPRMSTQDSLVPGRLRVDPESRRVLRHDVPVDLTRLEFDLLWYLSTRPNLVHRRDTLLAQVWGVTEPLHSRTVDVHIRRLRDKLGPYGALIATVRGVGYRFDGAHLVDVEPVTAG